MRACIYGKNTVRKLHKIKKIFVALSFFTTSVKLHGEVLIYSVYAPRGSTSNKRTLCILYGAVCWRRGSVVRTSVFRWKTFPDLYLTWYDFKLLTIDQFGSRNVPVYYDTVFGLSCALQQLGPTFCQLLSQILQLPTKPNAQKQKKCTSSGNFTSLSNI